MRIMGGFGWDHLEFIHGAHGGHGYFFSCLKARNLWGKSLIKNGRGQKCYGSTEDTDFFGLRERKKSLEEIFNKNMACGQK